MKTRELAAQSVLTTRKAAVEAAVAKETADREAREATAAALRLYDQDSELVADLLGVPAEELERDAKAVTAARAKEVIEALRTRAGRPRPRRSRPANSTSQHHSQETGVVETTALNDTQGNVT
ncbi:hypothetical protein PV682_39810 [Streptomyces niveiscabiei]|uniref:hypothetical protein n=1 Tax=Streptomyces niveiscabiei TaxID=164115 RepID=UPI0029B8DEDA|nr:hypothetical protein [Streptomyces niveiscabiei]MDX3387547.1 hypothetical protein [Streptomyces niveiscabiei]